MSNASQPQQHEQRRSNRLQQKFLNDSNLMEKNSNQQTQSTITVLQSINGNKIGDTSDNEQILQTAVCVTLNDCMKCYVKLPQLNIEESKFKINSTVQIDIKNDMKDFQEEEKQEKESMKSADQASSKEHFDIERARLFSSYYADPYLEDFNPMNSSIIIDLPWPKASQD